MAQPIARRVVRDSNWLAFVRTQVSYEPQTGVFRWLVDKPRVKVGGVAGTPVRGYIKLKIGQHQVLAHRLAWAFVHGEMPAQEIDHINGVGSDNRIVNLRQVDRHANAANILRARCESGLLGARYDSRRGTWSAGITRAGKWLHLGTFSTAQEAHAAYCRARDSFDPGSSARIAAMREMHPAGQSSERAHPSLFSL